MIVDTHVHLDDERYRADLDEVLNRARKAGVERFIIPGADAKTIDRAVEISEAIDMYAKHKKCVAIGECGLDYYRLEGSDEEKEAQKARQKEVFIAQIELAKKYEKPLIVHIRDASRDSKQVLIDCNAKEVGGVLHCYNADEELLSLADENFYFGIGGVLTFKNAKKLLNVLPKIPQDKLLIETDGPYLTPTPHRGERNEPLYTTFVAQKMSELLELELDIIKKTTTFNALKLFDVS